MIAPTKACEAFTFWQLVRGARAMRRAGAMDENDRHTAMEDLAVMHVNTDWPALKARAEAAIAELMKIGVAA